MASEGGSPSSKGDKHLDSGISKLMRFLQQNRKNSQALSMIFVVHDRAEKAKAEKDGVPFDDAGIRLKQLVVEFNKLGVGFLKKEANAFLDHFDTDGDGRLSFGEFMAAMKKLTADVNDAGLSPRSLLNPPPPFPVGKSAPASAEEVQTAARSRPTTAEAKKTPRTGFGFSFFKSLGSSRASSRVATEEAPPQPVEPKPLVQTKGGVVIGPERAKRRRAIARRMMAAAKLDKDWSLQPKNLLDMVRQAQSLSARLKKQRAEEQRLLEEQAKMNSVPAWKRDAIKAKLRAEEKRRLAKMTKAERTRILAAEKEAEELKKKSDAVRLKTILRQAEREREEFQVSFDVGQELAREASFQRAQSMSLPRLPSPQSNAIVRTRSEDLPRAAKDAGGSSRTLLRTPEERANENALAPVEESLLLGPPYLSDKANGAQEGAPSSTLTPRTPISTLGAGKLPSISTPDGSVSDDGRPGSLRGSASNTAEEPPLPAGDGSVESADSVIFA